MNLARGKLRQDLSELAVANQRFTTDDRHVERPVAIDERHEALHELVALVVVQASQRDVAAEMIVAVGVAAGTTERTLARDLDRDVRAVARKDAAPCLNDFARANVSRHVPPIMTCYSLCSDAR